MSAYFLKHHPNFYFKKGITWSTISSGKVSFRLSAKGTMISNAAGGVFGGDSEDLLDILLLPCIKCLF
jgi:hypothetical protein